MRKICELVREVLAEGMEAPVKMEGRGVRSTPAPTRDGIQSPVSEIRSVATHGETNRGPGKAQARMRGQCESFSDRQESNLGVIGLSPWERYEAGKRRAIALARSPEHYERLIACIADEVGV